MQSSFIEGLKHVSKNTLHHAQSLICLKDDLYRAFMVNFATNCILFYVNLEIIEVLFVP